MSEKILRRHCGRSAIVYIRQWSNKLSVTMSQRDFAEPDLGDQSLKPKPTFAGGPDRPRSSSMTMMVSRAHPN